MILWWSFVLQSFINAGKKGGSCIVRMRLLWMHEHICKYLVALCYKCKNFLTFDEQSRSLSNLHVTKLRSSQNIIGTSCLCNVMHVVRLVHSYSYVDI